MAFSLRPFLLSLHNTLQRRKNLFPHKSSIAINTKRSEQVVCRIQQAALVNPYFLVTFPALSSHLQRNLETRKENLDSTDVERPIDGGRINQKETKSQEIVRFGHEREERSYGVESEVRKGRGELWG